jgi:hypothetical protein
MSNGNMGGDNLEATGERRGLGSSELYAEWAARMQRGRGRHAAISRNLSSWANYKNWSERMKDSFESDQPAEKKK